ncbi:hypothetical protein GF339_04480 [candidate division KSB3 bacterium]|uniref:Uncharacterized protein n=1 Tax=candidate division KSB3 bacterium TaxID=2044937 RepID=A0A9D5JTI4_9BACT|nr:hypothetical protein [candidate division KSB3 bacterium]MBD3323815.1 hypothetical protein [candidate division KSB3 bacterium]
MTRDPIVPRTRNFRATFEFSTPRPLLAILLLIGVLLCAGLWPSSAGGYLLKDEKRGTNLSIFGLGMIRLNYADVDGDTLGFEESDEGFAEEFDTQEFLSFAVNGILFRDYALEGKLRYNQDDDPDWNFRFKLSRDENYFIFGDQTEIFSDLYFTRYTSPFRGATLHLQSDRLGITTFGAFTRGESEQEEIVPDGTSGPYTLDRLPVVPGSEIVTIEIRNQNDPNEVLDVIPQTRNVDYTIDYDTGEITFVSPIDSETFQGDPQVIVVTYRSEEDSSSFRTAITGARATVMPTSWVQLGATYVSEFDRDPTLSDGFDRRQDIYSLDSTFTLGDAITFTTEYALSQDSGDTEDTDDSPKAVLATLNARLGEKFDLTGKYHLTERDFLTFANPDLDPDEQELQLVGKYSYRTNHSIEMGYRFVQDNQPRDPDDPRTTTHRPYLAWNAFVREHTELYAKYEYLQTQDDLDPEETDAQTHAFLLGGIQEFLDVPVLNTVVLRGEYERTDDEDFTNQDPDTTTHQARVRGLAKLAPDLTTYVEQRERLIRDHDLNDNTERQDISEIGIDFDRWEKFSIESKYQYRVTHDLLLDEKESQRHTFSVSSTYHPFTALQGFGKFEIRDETWYALQDEPLEDAPEEPLIDPTEGLPLDESIDTDDRSAQGITFEGRLLYTPIKDLSARIRYEYDYTEDAAVSTAKTREDETEFRLNYAFDNRRNRLTAVYKIERDLLEAPPTPETNSRTRTYFVSAARQLSDRWDMLAQYKREVVDQSDENYREDVLAELGYEVGRFIKFVGGYQHSIFRDDEASENDYTAHSIYLKLIGKL